MKQVPQVRCRKMCLIVLFLLVAVTYGVSIAQIANARPMAALTDVQLLQKLCGKWQLVNESGTGFSRDFNAKTKAPVSFYKDGTGDIGFGDAYLRPVKITKRVLYKNLDKRSGWAAHFWVQDISNDRLVTKVNTLIQTYQRVGPCQAKSGTSQKKGLPSYRRW